uniref:AMP-activated protein kinase glycogen-binding domain-containing protein n=1 Tax=Rhodosorus marinus TaxID=101924 RepID=A0A7S3E7X2_9RHOD|mmetsp:Transcript_15998/g.65791  ORF Transcript_15998/g.65791 Transcript_15998/m.65791 type:complete len:226 (+) Transcript_15998:453-1130(+)
MESSDGSDNDLVLVEFVYPRRVKSGEVRIHGEWDGFSGQVLGRESAEPGRSIYSCQIELRRGTFRYYFMVNGNRRVSEYHPQTEKEAGGEIFNVRAVQGRISYEMKRNEVAEHYDVISKQRLKLDRKYARTFAGRDPKKELSPTWSKAAEKLPREPAPTAEAKNISQISVSQIKAYNDSDGQLDGQRHAVGVWQETEKDTPPVAANEANGSVSKPFFKPIFGKRG